MSDPVHCKAPSSIDLSVDLNGKRAVYKGTTIYIVSRTWLTLLECVRNAYPDPAMKDVVIKTVWPNRKSTGENNYYNTVKRLNAKLITHGLEIRKELRLGPRLVEIHPQTPTPISAHSNKTQSIARATDIMAEDFHHNHLPSFTTQPSPEAVHLSEIHNAGDKLIVGSVIELFPHRYIESRLPIAQLGWAPEEVLLVDEGLLDASSVLEDKRVVAAFAASEAKRRAENKETELKGDNNTKYVLCETSTPFHDVSDLTLRFRRTDYFSVLRARSAVESDPQVRLDHGHLEPEGNHIPQTFAIQFAVIFEDQHILAMFRGKNVFRFAERWSFSGEENLEAIDFTWDAIDRMKYAMLRTAQEEVFPLSRIYDKNRLLEAMDAVGHYIASMRMWSIFFEEPTSTFCPFCVFTLSCTVREYKHIVKDLVARKIGHMSNEGKYYAVALDDAPRLLRDCNVPAKQIFGLSNVTVEANKLHPTSAYRLARIVEAVKGAGAVV